MAQYGFVPSGGNAADRLALAAAAASAAASGSQPNSSPSGQPGGGGTLSLERFQCVIGDRFFLDLMGGKNPYLYAALKSFPLRDEHVPGAAPPAPAADGSVPERSAEDMPLSPAERALAEELRRQVGGCAARRKRRSRSSCLCGDISQHAVQYVASSVHQLCLESSQTKICCNGWHWLLLAAEEHAGHPTSLYQRL